MKLTDVIGKKAIVPALKAKDKKGVVAELVAAMKKAYPDERFSVADLTDAILEREVVGSTGLHGGVAIPHAHFSGMKDLRGAFGRSTHPVDFKSVDGEPTHLFFLLAAPESKKQGYLEALKIVSTAIKGTHFCKFLRAAKTAKDIEDVLRETEEIARV